MKKRHSNEGKRILIRNSILVKKTREYNCGVHRRKCSEGGHKKVVKVVRKRVVKALLGKDKSTLIRRSILVTKLREYKCGVERGNDF